MYAKELQANSVQSLTCKGQVITEESRKGFLLEEKINPNKFQSTTPSCATSPASSKKDETGTPIIALTNPH